MKKGLLLLLLLCLIPLTANAWTYSTRLGITIMANDSTVTQYNTHWKKLWPAKTGKNIGPKWIHINWNALDIQFVELAKEYGSGRNPADLRIWVMPLDYSCSDESSAPYNYEFSNSDYHCIDGMLDGNTIQIHLGDDPAQYWSKTLNQLRYVWDRPFCYTALSHELCHWMRGYGGVDCPGEVIPMMCQ